jgi:hypothetical protein
MEHLAWLQKAVTKKVDLGNGWPGVCLAVKDLFRYLEDLQSPQWLYKTIDRILTEAEYAYILVQGIKNSPKMDALRQTLIYINFRLAQLKNAAIRLYNMI